MILCHTYQYTSSCTNPRIHMKESYHIHDETISHVPTYILMYISENTYDVDITHTRSTYVTNINTLIHVQILEYSWRSHTTSVMKLSHSGYFPETWFRRSHMVVKTLLYCTRKCGCKDGVVSASCRLQPLATVQLVTSPSWNMRLSLGPS